MLITFEMWNSMNTGFAAQSKYPVLVTANRVLAFFSNDFWNKKNPYRVHQINFLLQNINDGDKMKA